jgi:nitrite reductase/ring-hydroxylating ferredoxin subunit/Fe-S cluster biogenesis protein NfuA
VEAVRQIESPGSDESAVELERFVKTITTLEELTEGWDDSHRLTVRALKSAIEDLHKEAIRRLIKALKDDPAAGAQMRKAAADRVVYGVLRFHGLIKVPLEERLQSALAEVRPFMHTHSGDVELVAIKPPDTVEIRLIGACHGCPASGQTLTEGVEKAIRAHCPEVLHVNQVSNGPAQPPAGGTAVVHFVSPFARHAKSGWIDVAGLAEVPEGGILEREVKGRSVLFSRNGETVSCLDNACAHLGMPLDAGDIEDGVITCRYHGFRYLLETGECLTAPEVQLKAHAVRVVGTRVQVRIED